MSSKSKYRMVMFIVVAVLLAIAGITMLFTASTLKYGLILLGVVAVGFLVWKAFIANSRAELSKSEERNEQLEHQVSELNRQIDELRHSPLNVTGLTPVLHLAVLNIDTSFTRTYIREDERRGLSFNGALRADISAEYGVRLEDVRFRYDEPADTLYVAGFRPGIISFSRKQLNWDLARTIRSRSFFGIELPPVDDKAAEDFTREMTEKIRGEVEKEIDERKIKEFEWLEPVVSRQVTDLIRTALCRPGTKLSLLETEAPEGFVGIDEIYRGRIAANNPNN